MEGGREEGRNEVLQEEDELHINSKQTSIPLVIVSHTHTHTLGSPACQLSTHGKVGGDRRIL